MKNSLQKEPKPKVNLQDIVKVKEMREHEAYLMPDGSKYWADRINVDTLATHDNCKECGVEFEKEYTYDRYCPKCQAVKDNAEWDKMEVAKWDGKSGLCIWDSDQYFFDMDDILIYCEDNEIKAADLKLVLCTEVSHSPIDICEHAQDYVHEDWDAPAELLRLEKQLNDYLATASTNTWTAGNKKVILNNY